MTQSYQLSMKAQELYDHLAQYLRASSHDIGQPQTRYYLEAEGMKFATRQLGLGLIVQSEVDKWINRYSCLSEALRYFKIPAAYFQQVLTEIQPRLGDSRIVAQLAESMNAFAGSAPFSGPEAGPFDLSADKPYIGIDSFSLGIIHELTGKVMESISERIGIAVFIDLICIGTSARKYIDSFPRIPTKIQ